MIFSNFMFSTHKLNMEISGALNQYMNICRDAFNGYTAKLNKSTKYVVMETLLLFGSSDISRDAAIMQCI